MEQAMQAAGGVLKLTYLGMGTLSKGFYKKYGKKAIPIITEAMSQHGIESGKMMQQMGAAKSMKSISDSYRGMMPMMDLKMEITEISDKAIQFKMPQCPYGLERTSKELCEAMMFGDKKLMSTFLGQEVEAKIAKSVAVGDKECDVTFSIK